MELIYPGLRQTQNDRFRRQLQEDVDGPSPPILSPARTTTSAPTLMNPPRKSMAAVTS